MGSKVLILGGTTEARELGEALRDRPDLDVRLSLAGRTQQITEQAVPVRIGGFGGVEGLEDYLRLEGVAAVVDATHPYARIISHHAIEAAAQAGLPFLALRRGPWPRVAGDRWVEVPDVSAAVGALGEAPRRVFLALGRKELAPFAAAPQHTYLIRSVDPVDPPLAVPRASYLVARGPFDPAGEAALLVEHEIERVVSRNSGGSAAYGKIAAARDLGVAVVLIQRPALPETPSVGTVEEAVRWVDHVVPRPTARGV